LLACWVKLSIAGETEQAAINPLAVEAIYKDPVLGHLVGVLSARELHFQVVKIVALRQAQITVFSEFGFHVFH